MTTSADITNFIGRKLSESEYFSTSPTIPVVVEESKNPMAEIQSAASKIGAFAQVGIRRMVANNAGTPGPYFDSSEWVVTIRELPQVWRAGSGNRPSAASIAEAAARILHLQMPTDIEGNPIVKMNLRAGEINILPDESFLIYQLSLSGVVALPNTTPTR
jgi:hypothetical protein